MTKIQSQPKNLDIVQTLELVATTVTDYLVTKDASLITAISKAAEKVEAELGHIRDLVPQSK